MDKKDELVLTYSCILSKDKKRMVRVRIEGNGKYAEGIVPDGTITKQEGFSEEEVEQLSLYLRMNRASIVEKAKEITGMQHWFQ